MLRCAALVHPFAPEHNKLYTVLDKSWPDLFFEALTGGNSTVSLGSWKEWKGKLPLLAPCSQKPLNIL